MHDGGQIQTNGKLRSNQHIHARAASGNTDLDRLIDKLKEYIFISDPAIIFAVLGTIAGNLLEGVPVWLMLVGAPASGKSMILDATKGIARVHGADSFDGEAAFLSGTAKKEQAKSATGGLLRMIEPHGALVIKDFTGVLSLPKDKIKKILDIFRQVYDGSWDRPVGSEGGKILKWKGKACVLSGVTGQIDQEQAISSTMGERWLYFRMDEANGFSILRRRLENTVLSDWEEQVRAFVAFFFEQKDLRFGVIGQRRQLTEREIAKISNIAEVAAHCRSGVTWDHRAKEITAVPETEMETRMGAQLGQLYIGMEAIEVPERERWRVLCKVALDSMPKMRRIVLNTVLASNGSGVLLQDIVNQVVVREAAAASRSAVDRAIIELAVHHVLQKRAKALEGEEDGDGEGGEGEGKKSGKTMVSLTPWMAKSFEAGFRRKK